MKLMARYLHPGILFPEETDVEIVSPRQAAKDAPARAYAFETYELPDKSEYDNKSFIPKPKNKSNKYYLGGQTYTLAEVEALPGDYSTLISNMKGSWDRVIQTPFGNWQPFNEGDQIVHV